MAREHQGRKLISLFILKNNKIKKIEPIRWHAESFLGWYSSSPSSFPSSWIGFILKPRGFFKAHNCGILVPLGSKIYLQ